MVEEAPAVSESSAIMTEQTPTPTPKIGETLENQNSIEATIESDAQGGTESTCNNINDAESSALLTDVDREKTLEFADELAEKGSKAFKENDFGEAAECFSRSLEIRVAHYGELALECLNAYYLYGRALLYKAQEEADPLVSVPKKEGETQQNLDKDGSVKSAINGESSMASVSSKAGEEGSSTHQEGTMEDGEKGEEEDEGGSDSDDVAEADEDEPDLDLAWKMLDVARAIAEKQHVGDTMEKVDILSALAEVALEREDIESSLSDYQKALSILERLVEPDNRQIAELKFRICLCLEFGSKPQEAIPYCQKAISICKSRLQRLSSEVKSSSGSATSSAASELDDGVQQSSNGPHTIRSVADKEAEIQTLGELSEDLEKKLEDLQQLVSNPMSILSEILGMSGRGKDSEKSASPGLINSSRMGTATSNGDFDSPTVSTARTNGAPGVTDLGVVGRGVKRVLMNTGTTESSSAKKPTINPSSDKGDDSSA
ncbi:hypothetical protein SLE2022_302760 [Rubroshorea leprosula]